MHTIAILSQKGGTGKTTLALHLAVAAEKDGQSTVVIDLDPQASSAGWKDTRLQETPVVVPTHQLGWPRRWKQPVRAVRHSSLSICATLR